MGTSRLNGIHCNAEEEKKEYKGTENSEASTKRKESRLNVDTLSKRRVKKLNTFGSFQYKMMGQN